MQTKRYTQKEYIAWINIRAYLRRKEAIGQEIPYDENLIDNYDLFLEVVGEAPSHQHELVRIQPYDGYFADNLAWQETNRGACKSDPLYKKNHLRVIYQFTVENGILTVFFRNQRTLELSSQAFYLKPGTQLQFHQQGLDVEDLKLRYNTVVHNTHFIPKSSAILGVVHG